MTAPRTLEFEIPGTPQGKGRPRFVTHKGASARTYTPKETVLAERIVRDAYWNSVGWGTRWAGPVSLNLYAYFAPPKSWPRWRKQLLRDGLCIPFCHTPDADNIWKLVADALNGVAWMDDRQVDGGCWRFYALRARTEVTIAFYDLPPTTKAELEAEK